MVLGILTIIADFVIYMGKVSKSGELRKIRK